ncbi:MAG: hypothetical protein ABSH08_17615 [Tepidisphaeraceae bacterium]
MTMLERKIEPVLDRAGIKERTKIEKHLAVCDAESSGTHGQLWRRVAAILGELAPLSIQSAGNNTWRFFVADGKYRMQVFALEDPCDGMLRIYLPDVLSQAVKAKILAKTATADTFSVAGTGTRLKIESLGAAEAADAPLHYKHMLGWNRKAMRVSLSTAEMDEKLDGAVQALAALAAKRWKAAEAAAE